MDFSDRVLDQTPQRVTKFLAAIAADPAIANTLRTQGGMTDADLDEGRQLLLAVLAVPPAPQADVPEAVLRQREAVAAIDAWDEQAFARADGALTRFFPAQRDYVLAGLAASTGTASVQGVATFLERLDALEKGTNPARAGTKEQDAKAIELLAKRGITPGERQKMAKLVGTALGAEGAPSAPLPAVDPAARREKLVALRLWYDDWSKTARSLIRKRGLLIRLGLAERKTVKKGEEPPPAA